MKILTLSLIVGGVGLLLLLIIACVFTHLETTPPKVKPLKHWEGIENDKCLCDIR